jgi:hypothetical protein
MFSESNIPMIRLLLSGLLLLCTAWLPGQLNRPDHYNALSARVLAVDHNIPNEVFDGLATTFALELGYRRQLGKYFGVKVPLKIGVIDVGELENPTILAIDLLGQIYPLGTNGAVSPYVHAGFGAVSEGFEDANNQIPLGAGFNFKLGADSWFNVQAEYRISNQEERDNVMAGLGYVYRLIKLDSDGDGILNRDDQCPDLPGPSATQGCPDTDQDGITDAEDLCPTVAGAAALGGCPDRDGDGLTDAKDACPEVAGSALTKGCPDRDEDGVPDQEDACPDTPGPVNFSGPDVPIRTVTARPIIWTSAGKPAARLIMLVARIPTVTGNMIMRTPAPNGRPTPQMAARYPTRTAMACRMRWMLAPTWRGQSGVAPIATVMALPTRTIRVPPRRVIPVGMAARKLRRRSRKD